MGRCAVVQQGGPSVSYLMQRRSNVERLGDTAMAVRTMAKGEDRKKGGGEGGVAEMIRKGRKKKM